MATGTTTERAAEIRKIFKTEHGWSSRQISVRADYFSMGSSITVLVKDPAIPLAAVKAIAERAESIRRCEITGEILSGGNRYVSVSYTREAGEAVAQPYLDAVRAAIAAVEPGSNVLQPIAGTPFLVGRPNAWRLTLWAEGWLCEDNTAEGLAFQVGRRLVGGGRG